MLSRTSRLTSPADFRTALRRGRRAGTRTLVVHVLTPTPPAPVAAPVTPGPAAPASRAGFVVSRAVGGATCRNRVKRRLRHLTRPVLEDLPPGSLLVVRALPAATEATYAELDADLRLGLQRAQRARQTGVSR